jgi:TatD DNase family protein
MVPGPLESNGYRLSFMVTGLIDTHAHLDMMPPADREDVICRAAESGVSHIITVGIDNESSQVAVGLAETHTAVWAAVGCHPQEAGRYTEDTVGALKDLAMHSKVVALGEMGLDYYHGSDEREAQKKALSGQLELAREIGLPIILHCRQAEADLLLLLGEHIAATKALPGHRGVVHCFSGDISLAQQYLDLGFHISLGAYIGYPSSRHLAPVLRVLPEERLLLETDCPFLPPQNRRGQRNEPAYLPLTASILANIRGVSVEQLAQAILKNTRRLFGVPPDAKNTRA